MGLHPFKWGPTPVWSKGSYTGGQELFHPLSPPMDTTIAKYVRAAIELCQSSGNLEIWAGYEVSNDAINWQSTRYSIGSETLDSDGIAYDADFSSINANTKGYRYVRFGVFAINVNSSTKIETGNASLSIDIRETA